LRQKLADMKAKFPNAPVSFDHGTHSDPRIAAAFEAAKWPEDPAPGNYYIQEKSVVFTDPAAYFGTEDFIKRIPGYNPNQEAAYMGDPIKQNEFIMRQMMDMKGFATMYAGEDPAEMIKRMYENAEEEARDLELRPGLVMTAAQVASLKKDMIWPENIKLADGNLVTVPRVYLAHSRPTEKGSGIRAAETVDIEDEDLVIGDKISAKNIRLASTNGSITVLAGAKVNAKESAELSSVSNTNLAGTVVAQSIKSHSANATNITGTISGGNILLTAGTDVTNSGLINASHNLSIEAVRDVMNLGGKIESEGDAQVIAGQNFVQETEVTRHGSGHNYYDTMGEKPELSIAGHLAVATGGDYIDIGSVTKAGSVKENVGGNRLIGSAVLEREVSYGFSSKSYYKAHDITNIGSSYEVVGSIDSHVGGDVAILGSKVNAGSDISYDVGGDVHVASLVDVKHEEGASTRTSSRWYGGKNTKSTSFTNHSEELVRAGIESGGRTKVRSSGDHAYIGSDLASKDGTRLEGHDISFLTQDTSNARIKSKSSRGTFWQSSHNQGSSGTKVNEGTVSGPLSVDASGSVVAEVRSDVAPKASSNVIPVKTGIQESLGLDSTYLSGSEMLLMGLV
jgi:filamentous hemagglutinin